MSTRKVDRTKDVSETDIQAVFENIGKLEKLFIREAKAFLTLNGQTAYVYQMDYYISAIINRAISLMRGFISLAGEQNYISAVPLIRLQIDNCLRFYAATLVSDIKDFFLKYLGGTAVRKMKDRDGQQMTDSYLVEKLDKILPGIRNLYVNTSDHVHLSNEHSFLQTQIVSENEGRISTRIGYYDFFAIDQKVDFAFNMFMASKFLLSLAETWKEEKAKIEAGRQSKNNS